MSLIERLECSAAGCEASFETEAGLSRHIQSEHRTKTSYRLRQCETCGAGFQTGLGLQVHLKEAHDIDAEIDERGLYSCQHCEETFDTSGGLNQHSRAKHKDPSQGKSTPLVMSKASAEGLKNMTGTIACTEEGCSRTFETQHGLEVHVGRSHERPGASKVTRRTKPKAASNGGGRAPAAGLSLADVDRLMVLVRASISTADPFELTADDRELLRIHGALRSMKGKDARTQA